MDSSTSVDTKPGTAEADVLVCGPAEAEPMAIEDIRATLVIRQNGAFLLTDTRGEVPRGNNSGLGLYRDDTRHLSGYSFSFSDAAPILLLSTAALGFAAEQVLTNPAMQSRDGQRLRRESVEVRRQRALGERLEEQLQVTSYHEHPIVLDFRYGFAADFADIFEIRGLARPQHGELLPPQVGPRQIVYSYRSVDGALLRTRIEFSLEPASINAESAVFSLTLQPRETLTLAIAIDLQHEGEAPAPAQGELLQRLRQRQRRWRDTGTRIDTSNEIFNAMLEQSLADLCTLWNDDEQGGYLSAGVPWFDALFGRDSAITSLQTLAFLPRVARQTLRVLAANQGRELDGWRDEEPGKIPHELRRGEMARAGEVPFGRYYGSIDATPLFLLLVTEYWSWTADQRLIKELLPAIRAALEWVTRYGDADGDGYLEYERRSQTGLLNQGWKDSGDAIVTRDGGLARQPIALVEVQGYLYAALNGLASIPLIRRDAQLAASLAARAERLKRAINRDFWLEEGFYALALDGDKQPVATIASNAAHLLYAGVAPPARATRVVERLLEPDLFSGWGIRTLSADSLRFNPLGYHVGSIWPHDNSIAAMGFKKYGKEAELLELATALFDAARAFDYYRLPELFCGAPRSAHHAPAPYPVACRPQAWAAATLPFVLQAILGLCPDAGNNQLLVVRPQLPYWLDHVRLRNLRVAGGSVDLLFERRNRRTQTVVLSTTGELRVSIANRWPLSHSRA